MAEIESIKSIDISNFEVNVEEIDTVEKYISTILQEENFNKLNHLRNTELVNKYQSNLEIKSDDGTLEFISVDVNAFAPYSTIMTEKEFFKIVGVTPKGISKRSGKYQESLYSLYLEAVKEEDDGFITDILNKAVVFENNLKYVKALMENATFMKKWHRNFGKESPINIFKNSGSLRKINLINNMIE